MPAEDKQVNKREVWVVEMWNDIRLRWDPTVGIGLARSEARVRMHFWKMRNPSDRFRVMKYIAPAPKKARKS